MPDAGRDPGGAGRELRRGVGWNAASLVASQGIGFLANVVLARALVPDELGLVLTLFAVVALSSTVFSCALDRVGVIELAHRRRRGAAARGLVVALLGLGALAGISVLALALVVPFAGVDLSTGLALSVAVMAAAEVVRSVAAELPRAWHRPAATFYFGLPVRLALSLVGVGILQATGNLDATTAFQAFAGASAVLAVLSVANLLWLAGPATPDVGAALHTARRGLPVMVAGASRALLDQGDILVVSAFFPPSDVAAYAIATRLANLLGSIVVAVGVAVLPVAAGPVGPDDGEAWEDGTGADAPASRPLSEELARTAATIAAIPTLLAAALLVVGAGPLTRLAFGDGYEAAPGLIRLLVIGQIVNALTGVCGAVVLRAGRRHVILVTNLAAAIGTISIEAAVAATGSLRLVALVSGLGFAAANVALYVYARRTLGVNCAPRLGRRAVRRPFSGARGC